MADRLQELLQQRALIQEHLAWLEGEIAAASGGSQRVAHPEPFLQPPGSAGVPVSPASGLTAIPRAATQTPFPRRNAPDDSDALMAKLAAAEKERPGPTKKGCWIIFCVILVATAAAAWAVLHFFYRD
ncbi:MAG: hypothetical protein ABIY47_13335 [Opitutaceae bacterium]